MTLGNVGDRGPVVRIYPRDHSWEVTLSVPAHICLTILLTMQAALRSPGYEPTEDQQLRMAAARWLTKNWLRRPIPSPRWWPVNRALHERADAQKKSPKRVLEEATEQAIFLVLAQKPANDRDLVEYLRWFRSQVANSICEDLLGPGWRRRLEAYLDDLEPESDAFVTEMGAVLDQWLDVSAARVCLTKQQEHVIRLRAQGYDSREIGKRLGIQASTVRVHLRRAAKKLQKLVRGM